LNLLSISSTWSTFLVSIKMRTGKITIEKQRGIRNSLKKAERTLKQITRTMKTTIDLSIIRNLLLRSKIR
jgi:hypothetical protein